MKFTNISLPYPVLGINDDVYPLLQEDNIVPELISNKTHHTFNIKLKHSNLDLDNLIESGKAEYVCEVNCTKTYFRKCFTSKVPYFEINLDRKSVAGKVELICSITAVEDIYNYQNKGFNPDYHGFSFHIEAGEVLAIFSNISYNFDIKYDKLYAAGSFMQVTQGVEGSDSTWFKIDSDMILIVLPPAMYRQYQLICNDRDFMEVFHASIVFNALVFALYHINEEEYEDKLWAESIKQIMCGKEKIKSKNYDLSDKNRVYELAQDLLGDPYNRLFKHLHNMKNANMEEE